MHVNALCRELCVVFQYAIRNPQSAILLVLALAGTLSAQDTHYWTHQYGSRSGLLGGAVIAGCDDTGAGYYNPARLGFINNSQLSASASLYQLDFLDIDDGAGTGTDIQTTGARIVPLLASGIFLFEGAPRHSFGFNIISRQYWSATGSARRKATENVIDDARSAGDEAYRGQLRINVSLQEYWAGITYSCRFWRYLSFGITHYGCVRLENIGFAVTTRAVGAPGTLFGADNIVDVDYYDVRTLWKAGLAFDMGWIKAGVTMTLPSIHLFGSGTVAGNNTIINLDTTGDNVAESIAIDDRQEGLDTQFRSPFSFGFGVEYTTPWYLRICVALEWFLPVGEYAVMRPETKNPIVGIPSPLDSRTAFQVLDQRRGAFNVAVGLQQKFNDWISGIMSFRTDFTVKQDTDSPGFQIGAAGWNIYHLATGLTFMTGKSEFSAGVQFSLGAGKFDQIVSFANPQETKGLVGDTKKVNQGYTSIALFVGYTYFF